VKVIFSKIVAFKGTIRKFFNMEGWRLIWNTFLCQCSFKFNIWSMFILNLRHINIVEII
jgi:hypothetical protein